MVYFAAKAANSEGRAIIKPVMPATPFVFEYFLFNSIYQHDWHETSRTGQLTSYERGLREWEQQKQLLDYLKDRSSNQLYQINRAFSPFQHLDDLGGDWTGISPDRNLRMEDGVNFFRSIGRIRTALDSSLSASCLDAFFEDLDTCREFIGKVRNNIFHGAKSLSQIWDAKQKRRIELYHHFIQSLNSLFFLTQGKTQVAADEVCRPIEIPIGDHTIRLSSMDVLKLRVDAQMKPEDPRLIHWANQILEPMCNDRKPSGAFFYPSSGCDLITPMLIALPICDEFHFYDRAEIRDWQRSLKQLRSILGNPKGFDIPQPLSADFEIQFDFEGTSRRILRVRADNREFLKSQARLALFFHRGDSEGEGGAGQPWDGEWFSRWKAMVPDGQLCAVLTDGTPYGLNEELANILESEPGLLSTPHGQPYRCGIIQNHSK